MSDLFDLSNFDKYIEDNCREVKKAEGGLPIALWESYSSFANSNGGVIILGVGERRDGTWYTTGLKNADKLKRNFWNTIHDTKKVSINLLSDKNVESYEVNGDTILVIYVPRAKREQKPVYINNDLFGGCYRRDWEGDYHCSKAEIKGMLRDAADETEDMKIVEQFDISVIDTESLKGFRNHHKSYRPEHVFNNLPDEEADSPLGQYSGAGTIFGFSGGVMEAALRTAHYLITGKELENLEFEQITNLNEGAKEMTLTIAGKEIHIAVAHGIKNVSSVLEKVRRAKANGEKSPYDFIEVMACPGGCVGGGGQPLGVTNAVRKARQVGLQNDDRQSKVRCSHQNPDIQKLYKEFLGAPLSEKAEELLHTHYVARPLYNK